MKKISSDPRELKAIILRSLYAITTVVIAVAIVVMMFSQVLTKQREADQIAHNRFVQIRHLLAENSADLNVVQGDLNDLYLASAEIVAYIQGNHDDLIYDIDRLRHIASLLGIEEIWIFDETGRIISGTEPAFFGMTMDDGEQMEFFKPMLQDKSLRLAQGIIPRTVDGKLFQYSAVWNSAGTHIIEVGRSGDEAMKMMEKYGLSHIFSLLSIDAGADLYAIDPASGTVVGTTAAGYMGKNARELGFDRARIDGDVSLHTWVGGVFSYCVFTEIDGHYIGRIVPAADVYFDLIPTAVWTILILAICAFVLISRILGSMDHLVIRNIRSINLKLRAITAGSLGEQVDSYNSLEFSELSRYINTMVSSLRGRVEERERIFRLASQHSDRLLYGHDIATGATRLWDEQSGQEDILSRLRLGICSEQALKQNSVVCEESTEPLRAFFTAIRRGDPTGEVEIRVRLVGEDKWYHLKFSTIFENGKATTALISVEDITERSRREQSLLQRADYDAMTGLRRRDIGEQLIRQWLQENCDYGGVLIALDLDDLKGINDTYGHSAGDRAIANVASILQSHFRKDDVIVRAGGDEFMIFLPGAAKSVPAVERSVAALLRRLSSVVVSEEGGRTIHCSAGCAVEERGTDDFESLYRRADMALYQVKRNGKNNYAFYVPSMEQTDYEFRSRKLLSAPAQEVFAVEELRSLLGALASFYQLVLSVNLSSNAYYLMEEVTDGVFSSVPATGLLTDFIERSTMAIHPDDLPEFNRRLTRECLLEAYSAGAANVYHHFRFAHSGAYRWVECAVIFYTGAQGDVCDFTLLRWADEKARELDQLYLELGRNISHQRQELVALQKQYSREDAIFRCLGALTGGLDTEASIWEFMEIAAGYYESDRVYILEFDLGRKTVSCSYEWCSTGVSTERATLQELPVSIMEYWFRRFEDSGSFFQNDLQNALADYPFMRQRLATQKVESVQATPLRQGREILGFVGTDNPRSNVEDLALLQAVTGFILEILDKRRLARDLKRLSYVDNLTGLHNRSHFASVMDQYTLTSPEELGIITLDINGLKEINETHGHEYGDRILRRVAGVLSARYCADACRIGGDEFSVLCADCSREEFQNGIVDLRRELDALEDCEVSIGFAWGCGRDEVVPVKLQQQADEMRRAEKHAYYIALLNEGRVIKNTGLGGEVIREIEAGRFQVYYQPQLDLRSGAVVGAEALVRKRAEDGSIILPGKFLPLYEVGGVISYVDLFVLKEACAALRGWLQAGYDLHVAVNFSRTTLIKNDIVEIMEKICREQQVPPSRIYVEVTEKISKLDNGALQELSRKLRLAGFRISLDDFGSEYSNLAILAAMDFDEVKLDRSLVSSMENNEKGRLVLESVLSLCRELKGTKSLAEGIERQQQLDMLLAFGCDCGQGYLFSKPVSCSDFEAYLRRSGGDETR